MGGCLKKVPIEGATCASFALLFVKRCGTCWIIAEDLGPSAAQEREGKHVWAPGRLGNAGEGLGPGRARAGLCL